MKNISPEGGKSPSGDVIRCMISFLMRRTKWPRQRLKGGQKT
jgi:hypothetical protein